MSKIQEFKDFLNKWVNLFPDNIRWNNVLIKSKPEECVNKMQKFINTYPQYTKDIIFAATKQYLKNQEAKNWEYTRQARYFINKERDISLLEQYCEQELQKETNPEILIKQETINNFYNDFI